MQIKLESNTNQNLNEFLRNNLGEGVAFQNIEVSSSFSNSKIRRLIISGAVSVNGKTVTRPGFELRGKSFV